ncbi:helix-turn-helix transcriptional regulator [Caenimonas koreensis]|uniref:helix-turn-helix transcriptional regulator n=1 Tax=Caenimonas koreensis TaxID=367474 RepID=UPI003784E63E
MPILAELSTAARQRRVEIGLSQVQLAELSGLSRATVNELETGKLHNLSLLRAEKLANALGLSLGVTRSRASKEGRALELAARTAAVSYGKKLPVDSLEDALLHGVVPPGYLPQLRAVLEEAPVGVLAEVAVEIENKHDVDRRKTWQVMRTLASVLKVQRGIWN